MNVDEPKTHIRELKETDLELLKSFQTYEPELKDFLVEDAFLNQKIGISRTNLLFLDTNLVGYITLLADTLRLEGELREFFLQKNVMYKTLPALKIGRLCVDDRYLKMGFGTRLLESAHALAEHTSKNLFGCRFLILDAKRNPDRNKDSVHFYKKFGFKTLKERNKGTTPMYLDLYLK